MKSVKDLSNEQLSDAITASLLCYNVYLEESFQIQQDLTLEQFRKDGTIQKHWEKVISSPYYQNQKIESLEDVKKLAAHFYSSFYRNHKDKEDEIFRAVMDVNSVKFPEKEPYDLLEEGIADTKKIINRDLWKFLKKESNIPAFRFLNGDKEQEVLDFLAKEEIQVRDLLSTEKSYLDSVNKNQIKASMLTKHIIKDLVSIDEDMLGIKKADTLANGKDYYLEDGIFHVGKMGKGFGASFGSFLETKNGETVLHISFRGTEMKSQSILKYGLDDYQNMERHYNTMKPLLEKVVAKMQETHGNLKVKVSGHSLGAAMVEKFLDEHKDTENIKYSGIALASPRAEHKAEKIVDIAEKTKYLKYPTTLILNLGIGTSSFILRKIEQGLTNLSEKSKHLSFLELGSKGLEKLFPYKETDERLVNIDHENDLVHKVGTLVYKKQKDAVILTNQNQEEAMKDHKVYNYFGELAEEAIRRDDMFQEHKQLFIVESAFEQVKYLGASNNIKFHKMSMQSVLKKIEKIQDEISNNDYSSVLNNRNIA